MRPSEIKPNDVAGMSNQSIADRFNAYEKALDTKNLSRKGFRDAWDKTKLKTKRIKQFQRILELELFGEVL